MLGLFTYHTFKGIVDENPSLQITFNCVSTEDRARNKNVSNFWCFSNWPDPDLEITLTHSNWPRTGDFRTIESRWRSSSAKEAGPPDWAAPEAAPQYSPAPTCPLPAPFLRGGQDTPYSPPLPSRHQAREETRTRAEAGVGVDRFSDYRTSGVPRGSQTEKLSRFYIVPNLWFLSSNGNVGYWQYTLQVYWQYRCTGSVGVLAA
jgi:hypothetical protein